MYRGRPVVCWARPVHDHKTASPPGLLPLYIPHIVLCKMENHEKYMRLALKEAEKSLTEGEFPVGCVMVADDTVVAQGHRINSFGERANELDHAEMITLRRLLEDRPGFNCSAVTVYATMEPCLMCYSTLLLNGVHKIVFAYEDVMGGGTNLPLSELSTLYSKLRVKLVPGVLRPESLALFKRFFRNHDYWRDSLLARYTMEQ